jgi:hypothetical protein
MGNFKFMTDFLDYTPTPSSEVTPLYAAAKVKDYDHLKRAWHTTVVTASSLLVDFGVSKPVGPFLLDDVNYSGIQAAWNDTNSWSNPTIPFQAHTVANDDEVGRGKKLIEPPAGSWGNLRYVKINILAQTPSDGAAYFRTGRLVFPQTILELTKNPSYGLRRMTKEPDPIENILYNGTPEGVSMGSYKQFRGSIGFNMLKDTDLASIRALNSIPRLVQQVILYENLGDASQAWLVVRTSPIETTKTDYNKNRISDITFAEII